MAHCRLRLHAEPPAAALAAAAQQRGRLRGSSYRPWRPAARQPAQNVPHAPGNASPCCARSLVGCCGVRGCCAGPHTAAPAAITCALSCREAALPRCCCWIDRCLLDPTSAVCYWLGLLLKLQGSAVGSSRTAGAAARTRTKASCDAARVEGPCVVAGCLWMCGLGLRGAGTCSYMCGRGAARRRKKVARAGGRSHSFFSGGCAAVAKTRACFTGQQKQQPPAPDCVLGWEAPRGARSQPHAASTTSLTTALMMSLTAAARDRPSITRGRRRAARPASSGSQARPGPGHRGAPGSR